jgi:ADP-ribose pyrophosphatase
LSFEDNKEQPYSYVKVKSGVCILPIVENEVIIIKQYRYSTERWSWELPAGMIDDGEESIDAAKRELTEETGYVADEIGYLGSVYPSEGYTNEVIYLYYAKCNNQIEQCLEATEQIKVYKKSFDVIHQMILNNEFKHGGGIAAIFKYMLLNK